METIKGLVLEPVGRQAEIIMATASASDTQKRNTDILIHQKKVARNTQQLKETINEKIKIIAEALDSYVQSIQRDLKIQIHEETGNIMVQVTSHESGKVIREIPPEALLDMAARVEELAGTLFDEKV